METKSETEWAPKSPALVDSLPRERTRYFAAVGLMFASCAVAETNLPSRPVSGAGAIDGAAGQAGSGAVAGALGTSGTGSNGGTGGAGSAANQGGAAGTAGSSTSGGAASEQNTGGAADDNGPNAGGAAGAEGTTPGTGGEAGAGEAPPLPLCAAHPLSAKASWVATASEYFTGETAELPSFAIDGTSLRWASGGGQSGDEWLQIDFGVSSTISQVTLLAGGASDYPVAYSVHVSDSPQGADTPAVASGNGSGAATAIMLPSKPTGRYLLIRQTGSSSSWWTVQELSATCAD